MILSVPLGFAYVTEYDKPLSFFSRGFRIKTLYAILCLILISLAFLATQSLGAILSLTLAVLIYFAASKMIKKKFLALFFVFILLSFGLVLFLRNTNIHYFNLPQFSLSNRLSYWQHALKLIQEHPLLGRGLGNYPFFKAIFCHNSYLQVWVEMGLVGFLALLALAGQAVRLADQKRSSLLKDPLQAGLWVGVLAFLIHNMVDFTFFLPEAAVFWWAQLALIFSYTKKD